MSDNNKILSVSVAAYNVESTLREALDSFLAPEVLEQVEILIVDDGSKDGTAAIGREYQEKYPGTFKLISKENGGWGSTLNAAIEAATGKYFKQLDGDDYYSVENLPIFLKFLSESDADMVCTAFAIFEDESGGVLSVESRIREYVGLNQTLDLMELGDFMPAMHALTVKTEVLQKANVRITEHCFYTDLEFVIKAYNNCHTFAYMELPVYMYRIGRSGQSMSVAGIRKHYKEHQTVLFTCLEYLEREVTEEYKKSSIRRRLVKACVMQYMFYFALECNRKQAMELKEFDRNLMERYPYFFEQTALGGRMKLLRKTNFLFYKMIGRQNTESDRRNKKHIFEGN